jgi:metallo-beta-lactamase family protein
LVARGFAGPIHATPATASLARPMLGDSAFLMQRDVEHVNRRPHAGPPRTPLYGPEDVETTLARVHTHGYHAPWDLFPGVRVEYWDAGHILGSALTTFEFQRGGARFRLGMSGDLGRAGRPILRDPERHPGVDALVLESTYGDRRHPPAEETERGLVEIVERTFARGGRVMVPAFAVGRTQELVATFHRPARWRARRPPRSCGTRSASMAPRAGSSSRAMARRSASRACATWGRPTSPRR